MPRPVRRLIALALVVAGAFAVGGNGDDFRAYLELARRMRHTLPLYAPNATAPGLPPFLGLFFAPFGLLAQRAPGFTWTFWYLFTVACLLIGVRLWTGALRAVASPRGRIDRLPALLSGRVLVPLAALAVPLAASLGRLHLAPVLLAIVAASARSLRKAEDRTAGGLVGLAAALAVSPALLLVPLAARHRWKAFAWGILTFVALSLSPVIRYEFSRMPEIVPAGMRSPAGWETLILRLASNLVTLAAFLAVAILAAALVLVVRRLSRAGRPAEDVGGAEIAAALALVAAVTPAAWNAMNVLLVPAMYLAWSRARTCHSSRARVAFWLAGATASGLPLLAHALGPASPAAMLAARLVPSLLLFALLLDVLAAESRGAPVNAMSSGRDAGPV